MWRRLPTPSRHSCAPILTLWCWGISYARGTTKEAAGPQIAESFDILWRSAMALDPALWALRLSPGILMEVADEALSVGYAVVRGNGFDLTLIARTRAPRLTKAALPFTACGESSIYQRLDRLGVVVLAGNINAGPVPLTGGSVCSCLLALEDGEWVVTKMIAPSSLSRHRRIQASRGRVFDARTYA